MGMIIIFVGVVVRVLVPKLFSAEKSSSSADVLQLHAACDIANLIIVLGIAAFAVDYFHWRKARLHLAEPSLASPSSRPSREN